MKRIELVRGISSSALAFGCASVSGAVSGKRADTALREALDLGINHLDLARAYGYGQAESLVGKVIKGRRDNVVLASKFGIEANWKARLFRPFKPVLRAVKSSRVRKPSPHLPNSRPAPPPRGGSNNRIAELLHDRIQINAENLRSNLERSLSSLGTDYLDYYFVHEPRVYIENWEELLEAAEQLKSAGKIRAFGISYASEDEAAHRPYLDHFDLRQTNVPETLDEYAASIASNRYDGRALFAPSRAPFPDLSPHERLRKLFADFPKSVIIGASFCPKHLRENASLAIG